MHPEIIQALDGETGDSLAFHSESWTGNRELLERADRILFCADSDRETHRVYEQLTSWFVSPAQVHVRLTESVPGIESFGGLSESFTPEFVMKDEVNRRAILMNDIYN